jgi:hypothetical protein
MNSLVHNSAFGGKEILCPRLLDVNQSTLPLAEKEMLQGG